MKNVMTPYYSILDRDVPAIIAYSKNLARQGIIGDLDVYYKHEAITAASPLSDHRSHRRGLEACRRLYPRQCRV